MMGKVIRLFPDLPDDLREGNLVWLPDHAMFGTISAIRPSGMAEIAIVGGTVNLHVIRERHKICADTDAGFGTATANSI